MDISRASCAIYTTVYIFLCAWCENYMNWPNIASECFFCVRTADEIWHMVEVQTRCQRFRVARLRLMCFVCKLEEFWWNAPTHISEKTEISPSSIFALSMIFKENTTTNVHMVKCLYKVCLFACIDFCNERILFTSLVKRKNITVSWEPEGGISLFKDVPLRTRKGLSP